MRILFFCTDVYGGHGGIALFNREFVEALLADPRVEEVVVVPRVVPHPGAHPVPPRVTYLERAARSQAVYAADALRLSRETFDLVICGHVNLLPVARLAAKHPLLITHGIDAWKRLDRLRTKLLHDCTGVISVSALTRDRLIAWSGYQGRTFVLPNAVRLENYGIRPKPQTLIERYHLKGKRVVLTVGRISGAERYKGFDEMLEVLVELPQDVVSVMAGGGNDASRLQKKARALGVASRVVFTGLFPESEKADLYALADVYAMPSRGEGFGFVFLEAMASGIPVIASKHDGGREALLDGKLGLLVDPANPAEIRAAIIELLARGKPRIPEGLEFFAFPRFIERVGAIVDSVVG
ncbi:MAG TPA: glycosyltransferase family 4 protein [Thermoanaerobaculia bacterium]|jgi:glycosyltransferase involved in cell wall biosynthesis